LRAIGFEPDREECARLNQAYGGRNVKIYPYAIGAADGMSRFYHRSNPDASGLVPFPDFYERMALKPSRTPPQESNVATRRLDSVLTEIGAPTPHFLKIDAEGAESLILEGASATLASPRLLGLEVETRFFSFGEQGRFRDISSILDAYGFSFFDLGLVRHTRAALPDREELAGTKDYRAWQEGAQVVAADALFLRDLVREKKEGRHFSDEDRDGIIFLMGLFESYRLFDCAAELVLAFAPIFGPEFDKARILDFIAKQAYGAESYEAYMAGLKERN
ncbi:MAG: FkbM family methyltransferase, partial [Kiloniellales bacterium]|nr:FkbM family methyltransferase [Kiloniellales bacterium]